MKILSGLILPLILALGFIFRIYLVDTHPIGVTIDEASFGVNAYSILETGKDEHGTSYPIIFKAFGDQKLPVYAYSIVPFIKFLGISNLSVRLPSVIAGTLFILLIYFLTKEVGFNKKQAMLTCLIAALSPWGIILSRFGYESNIGLLFFTSALLSFLLYIKKEKYYYLILSGILFGLTWYSYIAFRMITPLIVIALIAIFLGLKRTSVKKSIFLIATFLIVTLPLFSSLLTNAGTARFKQIGIFSEIGIPIEINEDRSLCSQDLPKVLCYALYNKPNTYTRTVIEGFLKVYSPEFLFLQGEKELDSLSVKHFGLLPLIAFPFFIIGIAKLIINVLRKKSSSLELLCLAGLIITPIPSILSGEPQRVRLSALFPFVLLTIAYGISYIDIHFKKKTINLPFYLTTSLIIFIIGIFFMVSYLTVHVKKSEISYASQAYRLVNFINTQPKTTTIYITSFGYSIYYYLYYSKIPPVDIQKYAVWEKPDETGFAHITDYKNLHVVWDGVDKFYCPQKNSNETLYITDTENGDLKPVATINSFDNIYKLLYIYNLSRDRDTVCPIKQKP